MAPLDEVLSDADAAKLAELERRIARLEERLQGIVDNHHLWDGS